MQKVTIEPGSEIIVRDDAWVVDHVARFPACTRITIRRRRGWDTSSLDLLLPFDRPRLAGPPRVRASSREHCARLAAGATATTARWTELWTAADARIDLLPWQLEPALAALRGSTRFLLADEVGLGKTIQAGLLLAELRARHLVANALILTPAGLRAQWRDELHERFRIPAAVLDPPALGQLIASAPPGVNPWARVAVAISSIDLVKRSEHRAAVESTPLDLLIVDEAHHLRPGTDRGALVAQLASRVPWVVLMTATPHSGDERAFTFLTSIGGDSGGHTPLAVFRRQAATVRPTTPPRSRVVSVRTGEAERALARELWSYAQGIWQEHGTDQPSARLVAMVLARRAASSPHALRISLARRARLLQGAPADVPQPALPWDERDDRDALMPDAVLRAPGLYDPAREHEQLERLQQLVERVPTPSSKVRWLLRLLSRLREPLVVFSEFRDTIDALALRLAAFAPVCVHGGLSPAERRVAIGRFTSGGSSLLLTTDAAGEGLNLQARCRLVVNVDVPWNPTRLEQRVGRVDRLGQSCRVHARHLIHCDSFEQVVIETVRAKAEAARTTLGEAGDRIAEALAAAVFGARKAEAIAPERVPERLRSMLDREARGEVRRVLQVRRLTELAGRAVPVVGGVTGRRLLVVPRRPARTVGCLFAATVIDASGRIVARHLIPLACELAVPATYTGRRWVLQLAAIGRDPRLLAAVQNAVDARVNDTGREIAEAARRMSDRMIWLAHRTSTRRIWIQPSLFDGRTLQRAAATAKQGETLRGAAERRAAAIAALADVRSAGTPQLVGMVALG